MIHVIFIIIQAGAPSLKKDIATSKNVQNKSSQVSVLIEEVILLKPIRNVKSIFVRTKTAAWKLIRDVQNHETSRRGRCCSILPKSKYRYTKRS